MSGLALEALSKPLIVNGLSYNFFENLWYYV